AVWPAAQPPLGLTARLAIALAAGGIGALLGLWLAAKVAAAQAISAPRRRQPTPARDSDWGESAKRPISARDELGSDSLDDAGDEADRSAGLGRRRPLAVTEETGRSDFLECAPLPGAGACDPEALDLGGFEGEIGEPPLPKQPLFGSAGLSRPASAMQAPADPAAPDARCETVAAIDDEREPVREDAAQQAGATPRSDPAPTPLFAAPAATPTAKAPCAPYLQGVGDRPLNELGIVELVERFAQSLQRRAEAAVTPITLPQLKASRGHSASEVDRAPAELTGVSEEGASLSLALAAEEPAVFAIADEQKDDVATPLDIPAALRPIEFELADEDDELAPPLDFGLSLAMAPRPFDRADASDAREESDADERVKHDDDDSESDESGYGSLLAMKSPLGAAREFVRIDDETDDSEDDAIQPVVVFPGQPVRRASPAADGPSRAPFEAAPFRPFDGPAPGQAASQPDFADPAMPTRPPAMRADPRETERSLREALEKLQRMSGAA
ncbi:MAG: hypothetical protein ACTHKM_03290, partial [Tsuneonella sp.]